MYGQEDIIIPGGVSHDPVNSMHFDMCCFYFADPSAVVQKSIIANCLLSAGHSKRVESMPQYRDVIAVTVSKNIMRKIAGTVAAVVLIAGLAYLSGKTVFHLLLYMFSSCFQRLMYTI